MTHLLTDVPVSAAIFVVTVFLPGVVVLDDLGERLALDRALEQGELLPVDPPRPPEVLPLTGRPAPGTRVVVVGERVVGREEGLPRQQHPHCLLWSDVNIM